MVLLNRIRFQLFCFFLICASNFLLGQTQVANLDPFNAAFYNKFGNGKGINRVSKVLELANGQILVGGTFEEVNGFPVFGLARLNPDGSFDHTFHSGFDFSSDVYALAELPSGKILVGGSFNSYDGVSCGDFVVLNANGTRDVSYTGIGTTGSSTEINDIQIAPGNKVIVAGYFSSFNGVVRNGLVRLTASLQVDTSFGTTYSGTSNGEFKTILVFPDGGILVGGDFTNYWGNGASGLIKLTAAGNYDPNFNLYTPAGFNARVNKVKFTADGKILMCGKFNSYGGHTTECIVRLNADGSVDNSFQNSILMNGDSFIDCIDFNGNVVVIGAMNTYLDTNGALLSGASEILADNEITMIDKISDGSFVIGGYFSIVMNRRSGGLVKFSGINVIDKHFFTPPASHNKLGWYGNGMVENIEKYSNTQYLVSGRFTEFNGETINGLVRVNYNGELDPAFNAHFPMGVVITAFAVQPDGKVLVNYQNNSQDHYPKLVRLNANGSHDNSFSCSLHYPIYKILWSNSNDRIIVAGDNQSLPNRAVYKLLLDGTVDPSFTPYTPSGGNDVYSVIELSNGRILVASRWGGVTKIKTNGVEDPTFSYNYFSFSTTVTGFALQSDGKIIFSAPGGNRIYRLNANGTTDATYLSQYNVSANSQEPSAIELQSDDKLIVYGNGKVYRFNVDGSLDNSFKEITIGGGRVNDFILDSNRLLIGGDYIRVNNFPINDLVGIDYSTNNTVGLDEFNSLTEELFHIYPNPVGPGQKLNWELEETPESISIYSMEGRLLQETNVSSGEKAIEVCVASGSYIVRANIGLGKYKVAKLMVRF